VTPIDVKDLPGLRRARGGGGLPVHRGL